MRNDHKIDIVLVGPWSRLCNQLIVREDFLHYLKFIRSHGFIQNIIYSSSDEIGVVPTQLFDQVCSNHHASIDQENLTGQNLNTSFFIRNSSIGIAKASSDFVVKVRSDLYIKDFVIIRNNLIKSPNKVIVDYHENHSLLIPYYYPDFLFASKLTLAKEMFYGNYENNDQLGEKVVVLSPFKSLQIGRLKGGFMYTEYSLWTYLLRNFLGPHFFIVQMYKLTAFDFLRSIKFIIFNITLINRNDIFISNEKFKFESFLNAYFFKYGILKKKYLLFLFIYHYYLFLKRSSLALFKITINSILRKL
jgi:hypothetical protein